MTFRVAQISDTHLSAEKPFFRENYERLGEALARAKPDLVVNSGDISLNGAELEADLTEARRRHDALGLAVRCIPGNHDIGDNQDVQGRHSHPIDPARRERYRRHFGADWWSIDVPGWRLLAVNAQLFGSDLDASVEQDAFVAEATAHAGGRQVALFIHKPLFDSAENESFVGGRFLNPVPRRRLLTALGRQRPALVACGHVHQYRVNNISGTRHVWAPSTAYVIPDAYQPRYGLKHVGYVAYDLRADGTLDHRFVTVPGMVNLSIADFPAANGPMD